jgi:hypothetical protein
VEEQFLADARSTAADALAPVLSPEEIRRRNRQFTIFVLGSLGVLMLVSLIGAALAKRFPDDPAAQRRVTCVPTSEEERIYNDLLSTPDHRSRVLQRHGITEHQLRDIEQEARANKWARGALCS